MLTKPRAESTVSLPWLSATSRSSRGGASAALASIGGRAGSVASLVVRDAADAAAGADAGAVTGAAGVGTGGASGVDAREDCGADDGTGAAAVLASGTRIDTMWITAPGACSLCAAVVAGATAGAPPAGALNKSSDDFSGAGRPAGMAAAR